MYAASINVRGRQVDVTGGIQRDVNEGCTVARAIQREIARSDVRVFDLYAATVELDNTGHDTV